MTTPTTPMRTDAVAGYVAAVRARLGHLTGEEIEELTGGLEADLSEALAGSGANPYDVFGDPVAYADELRTAAGLPAAPRGSAWTTMGARRRAVDTGRRFWPPVRDFLVVLRPAWWVLRAWVAYRFVYEVLQSEGFFPGGFQGFLVLAVFVLVSVQLGRMLPYRSQALRAVVIVGNVLAVLLIPVTLDAANRPAEYYTGEPTPPPPGLARDGEAVLNVFPFDAQGNPLRDVRLYDERGRALVPGEVGYVDDDGRQWSLVPRSGLSREQSWNMFPLQRQEETYADDGTDVRLAPEDAPVPFPTVPPLLAAPAPVAPSAAPSAGASVTPTTAPSATTGPTPVESPTPEVTVTP